MWNWFFDRKRPLSSIFSPLKLREFEPRLPAQSRLSFLRIFVKKIYSVLAPFPLPPPGIVLPHFATGIGQALLNLARFLFWTFLYVLVVTFFSVTIFPCISFLRMARCATRNCPQLIGTQRTARPASLASHGLAQFRPASPRVWTSFFSPQRPLTSLIAFEAVSHAMASVP